LQCIARARYGNGYLEITAFSYPVAGGVTYCGWFKRSGGQIIFESNNYYVWFNGGANALFYHNLTNGLFVQTPLQGTSDTGNWKHFCITHNSNTEVKIYIDNVLLVTGNLAYSTTAVSLRVAGTGTPSNFYPLAGYIDDFRYYNTIILDVERGYIYTNIFPLNGDYVDENINMCVNVGSLPFINRGNGKTPLAFVKMEQSQNNIISSIESTFLKPNDIGEISIDLIDLNTNEISTKLQSNISFLFEVEGI
jgi:hypothetical protein